MAAGDKAFSYPSRAVGAYYGSDNPMSDPALATQVVGIWSLVDGFANLILAKRFALPREATADQMIPAMIRQYFLGPQG